MLFSSLESLNTIHNNKQTMPLPTTTRLTDEQLKERYGSKKDLALVFEKDKDLLQQFLLYTLNRLGITNRRDKKHLNLVLDECMKRVGDGNNDYEVYSYIRTLQCRDEKPLTDEELVHHECHSYSRTIDTKIQELLKTLRSNRVPSIKTVLDIGTERLEFLDKLQQRMNISCHCIHGINIDCGFCHYDESFKENTKDKRFQFYDGKVIPFEDNEFDLITMYSVIHHIPSTEFQELCHEIARVCRGYLYIKDVDITDKCTEAMFRMQHYVYEGVFLPGGDSYLNTGVTRETTINALKNAGFVVVDHKELGNFNKSYYTLLKKHDARNMVESTYTRKRSRDEYESREWSYQERTVTIRSRNHERPSYSRRYNRPRYSPPSPDTKRRRRDHQH
jgi:ubiquinone/menaquinone biosynthesis C-methylase UbiE